MPELKIKLEPDNFIQEYITTFMEQSSGHIEFKFGAALAALSVIQDRRIFIPLKFATKKLKKGITPNVWMLLIGQSSVSGKSTCFEEVSDLMQSSGIGAQMPNSFSRESLAEIISETPISYYFNDEIAGLLKDLHKSGGYLSGLADDLCKLYDSPAKHFKRLTQKKSSKNEFVANNVCITFFGGTTTGNFKESVEPADLESGLLARFLICNPSGIPDYQDVELASVENMDGLNNLSEQLIKIWNTVHQFQNLIFKPSKQALKKYNNWQRAEREKIIKSGTDTATINARMRIYAFKLASLYYLGSKQFLEDANREYQEAKQKGGNLLFLSSPEQDELYLSEFEIPDKYFFEAMEHTAKYFMPTSNLLLANTIQQDDRNHANSIINILKKAGEHTLSRSQLLRRLSRYIHAAELDRLIQLLEDELIVATAIDTSTDKNGRRRNTQVITLIDEKEANI